MFENIMAFFKKIAKKETQASSPKDAAKERLHLVLMQDRANVSADFLELMKQEIIEVIKKYIDVDESAIDVRLTNKSNEEGANGAPSLYANIPILNIKNDVKKADKIDEEKVKPEIKNNKEKNVEDKKEKTERKKEDNFVEEKVEADEQEPIIIQDKNEEVVIQNDEKELPEQETTEVKEKEKIKSEE